VGPFRPFREVVELTERYIIGPYPAPYSVGFEKGCLFRLSTTGGNQQSGRGLDNSGWQDSVHSRFRSEGHNIQSNLARGFTRCVLAHGIAAGFRFARDTGGRFLRERILPTWSKSNGSRYSCI